MTICRFLNLVKILFSLIILVFVRSISELINTMFQPRQQSAPFLSLIQSVSIASELLLLWFCESFSFRIFISTYIYNVCQNISKREYQRWKEEPRERNFFDPVMIDVITSLSIIVSLTSYVYLCYFYILHFTQTFWTYKLDKHQRYFNYVYLLIIDFFTVTCSQFNSSYI